MKETTLVEETYEGDMSKDDINIALEYSLKSSEPQDLSIAIQSSISKVYADLIQSIDSVEEIKEINYTLWQNTIEF